MLELDPGRASPDEYVEFRAAGERTQGEHHCSACGYGVVVHVELPRCPMCGGETWEPAVRRVSATPAR